MSTYCDYAPQHPLHHDYHANEYGFPLRSDTELFERLVLEINQAGLSWGTILRKREGFRQAYQSFDPARVAVFGDADRQRLMADPGIIRNRLKIDAAIHNAAALIELAGDYGSFAAWIEAHHPLDKASWVKLFRRHFRFVGGEIVGEFLMSTGWLPGAHRVDCPVFARIATLDPPWMGAGQHKHAALPQVSS